MRTLWGNVLLEIVPTPQTTQGGLALPQNAQQAPKDVLTGKVIEVGSGSLAFDGSPIPMEPGIVKDATILFNRYEAKKVPNSKDQYIVDQRHILAVL